MGTLFQPGYLPAQTIAGNVFTGQTALAGVAALPIATATGQVFGIWNPLGSGVEAVLIALDMGVATGTTPVASAFCLSWLANAGSQVASSAPITAFTAATPTNLRLGLGNASKVKFTPSAATMTAPVFLKSLGLSFASTTATQGGFQWAHADFNGAITIPPGNFVGVCGSTIQSGTVLQISMDWMELPYTG
jgi:hypothetical protein